MVLNQEREKIVMMILALKCGLYKKEYKEEDLKAAVLSFCVSGEIYLSHWHKNTDCKLKLRTPLEIYKYNALLILKGTDSKIYDARSKIYDDWS